MRLISHNFTLIIKKCFIRFQYYFKHGLTNPIEISLDVHFGVKGDFLTNNKLIVSIAVVKKML